MPEIHPTTDPRNTTAISKRFHVKKERNISRSETKNTLSKEA